MANPNLERILVTAKMATDTAIDKAIDDAWAVGYQDGYDAAIQNVMAAAKGAAPTAAAPAPAPAPKEAAPRRPRVVLYDRKRAPWGTSTKAANIALDAAGDAGIDISMVVAAAADLGYPVAESSARSILIDMTARGELERGPDGRWRRIGVLKKYFPSQENGGTADQADPAASDPPDEGGHDERTALAD